MRLFSNDASRAMGHNKVWADNTLLSGVTATGAGAVTDLGAPVSQHACTVTIGGTAPTSVTVGLYGSQDGINFQLLGTQQVITTSGTIFQILNSPGIRYILGNYVSKVGGDGTTSVTLSVTSGGN